MTDPTQNPLSDFLGEHPAPAESSSTEAGPTWEQIRAEQNSLKSQLENAQRLIGEQGRQLGEYRSLLAEKEATASAPSISVSDDDFITSPTQAVEKVLDAKLTTKLSKMESELENLRKEKEAQAFQSKHPNAVQLFSSSEFVQWANRPENQYLAQRASSGDLDAAGSLVTMWEVQHASAGGEKTASPPVTERGTAAPHEGVSNPNKRPISRERYRQALARGERIPPDVMREINEAYKTGNWV